MEDFRVELKRLKEYEPTKFEIAEDKRQAQRHKDYQRKVQRPANRVQGGCGGYAA